MRRAQRMTYALSQICSGRESHADLVWVKAALLPHGCTIVTWHDDFTAESGELGVLRPSELEACIRKLFPRMRLWRSRCEQRSYSAYARATA